MRTEPARNLHRWLSGRPDAVRGAAIRSNPRTGCYATLRSAADDRLAVRAAKQSPAATMAPSAATAVVQVDRWLARCGRTATMARGRARESPGWSRRARRRPEIVL